MNFFLHKSDAYVNHAVGIPKQDTIFYKCMAQICACHSFLKKLPQCCPWDSLKKNYKILCIFAYVTSRLYLYSLFFSSRESTSKVAEWVRRWPKSWKDPGSNPAWTLFLPFFAQAQFFFCIFCANLTHVLTHACVDKCIKCAKMCTISYNARKFDAQSAHVARLRQYCAKQKVVQYQRKLYPIWFVGLYQTETQEDNWQKTNSNCFRKNFFSVLHWNSLCFFYCTGL